MNRLEIREAVRDRIGVPAADGVLTDTVLQRFIDRGLQRISGAHDWWWLETEGTVTAPGFGALGAFSISTELTRFIRVASVVNSASIPLIRVTMADLEPFLVAEGTPRFYCQYGDSVFMGPQLPASDSVTVRYLRAEQALGNDTVEPALPDHEIDMLIEYVASLALRQVAQMTRADEALQSFERLLESAKMRASAESESRGGALGASDEGKQIRGIGIAT